MPLGWSAWLWWGWRGLVAVQLYPVSCRSVWKTLAARSLCGGLEAADGTGVGAVVVVVVSPGGPLWRMMPLSIVADYCRR